MLVLFQCMTEKYEIFCRDSIKMLQLLWMEQWLLRFIKGGRGEGVSKGSNFAEYMNIGLGIYNFILFVFILEERHVYEPCPYKMHVPCTVCTAVSKVIKRCQSSSMHGTAPSHCLFPSCWEKWKMLSGKNFCSVAFVYRYTQSVASYEWKAVL